MKPAAWLLTSFFLLLSVLGFIVSILVHGATYGSIDIQGRFASIWFLHLGIFIVVIPGVLLSRLEQSSDDAGKKGSINQFNGSPRWLKVTCGVLFAYAFVNFCIFMVRMEGTPRQEPDGTYVLREPGRHIRKINVQEYTYFRNLEVRGFSGHWMLFYALGASLIVAYQRRSLGYGKRPLSVHAPIPEKEEDPVEDPVIAIPYLGPVPRYTPERHERLMKRWLFSSFLAAPILSIVWIRPTFFPNMRGGIVGLFWIGLPLVAVGAVSLIWKAIPARCPKCNGPTRLQPNDQPATTYRCQHCGWATHIKR